MTNFKKSFLVVAILSLGASQAQALNLGDVITPDKSTLTGLLALAGSTFVWKGLEGRLNNLTSLVPAQVNKDAWTVGTGLLVILAAKSLGHKTDSWAELASAGLKGATFASLLNLISNKGMNYKNIGITTGALCAAVFCDNKVAKAAAATTP
jgi:hypothetical protein